MKREDIFDWLVQWYFEQCNGIWERVNQIKIYTVSNPGWTFKVGLKSTILESYEIESDLIETAETDWYLYYIRDAVYDAGGDTSKLPALVEIFRSLWENKNFVYLPTPETMFSWLIEWRKSQCDGDWEHENGIAINTNGDLGWQVKIEVNFTELDGVVINHTLIQQGLNDWYSFSLKDGKFLAEGDPKKLSIILEKFKEIWVTYVESRKN
ncbi:Imm53 family immunity protein [Leptospira santarosai]|uniref:Imm53 family immunity protein n=1 Tax=Leptospira santarosai TaxID=28183 RepID=UPI0024AEE52C|nr:Imm53 family immunity protein [Leptospira santarosai]MDI7184581.1 Imm53 family immunity protein [Leptospira santarosai]